MRQLLLLITLLLLALASCRDGANPTKPKKDIDPAPKGSVSGYVIDSATNLPVSGVIVNTFPITSSTRTDWKGKFELLDISPDLYTLHITHKDYFAYTLKIKVSDGISNDLFAYIIAKDTVNTAPNKPTLLRPKDKFRISFNHILFQWEGIDSDNDTLLYDIYFRTVGSDFKLIATNVKAQNYEFVFDFIENNKYQWYVVAKDKFSSNTSEIFNFRFDRTAIINIPNIIGYWKFDGDAYDYGPNSYLSEMENVDFVPDRKDYNESSANFKGHGSIRSNVVLPVSLQLSSEFTIALWVRPSTSPGISDHSGYFDCVSKWGTLKEGKASWAFGINSSSSLFLTTYSNTASSEAIYASNVTAGKWQHIAVTFDNGTASFYIGGTLVKTAKKMMIPQKSIYNTTIGGRQDNKSAYNGSMDDLYIFDRALSPEEILMLYKE